MKIPGNKILVGIVLVSLLTLNLPFPVAAAFVPCGTKANPQQCAFKDLIALIARVINYLMATAAIVAMYYILLSAWNLITALGNEEKIKKAKTGINNAVVGFGMVVLAFVFVNLLVNGIFGKTGATRQWWEAACVFDITQGCPLSPGP